VEVVWRPDEEARERTNALRLARELGFDDYASLVRFSAEEPERFWPAAIEDLGLEFSRPWDAVVDESRGPEWATWFVGGRLNLAWNCVHRWARGERADEPAAVWQSEDGQRRSVSYRELSSEVTRLAEALARLGVGAGDRVAITAKGKQLVDTLLVVRQAGLEAFAESLSAAQRRKLDAAIDALMDRPDIAATFEHLKGFEQA